VNDVFPHIERRFKADKPCVTHCRKLYQLGEDSQTPKAYARWIETGGANLDGFDQDITQHDGEFVLYSSAITATNIRKMADAITNTFDDQVLLSDGAMNSVSMHRQGPPLIEREGAVFQCTIPYIVYAVLGAQSPARAVG